MRPADPSTVAETSACRARVRSGRARRRAAGVAPIHMGWTWKFGPSGEKVIAIGRVDPGGSRGCWMARLYRRIMLPGLLLYALATASYGLLQHFEPIVVICLAFLRPLVLL